ncbi:MAG: hypothetical protein ABSH48_13960 [Verrucomicrobiota bacterium]|jgi:predicted regulator of Ras-like GTPase activity (Roadblock/LC7/MglB family)
MAISIRTKFAGFLRGLFGRGNVQAPAEPVTSPAPAPATVLASTPPFSIPTPQSPAARPAPVSVKAGPAPAGATGSSRTAPNVIELPLAAVIAALPIDLRAKLVAAPPTGASIHLQAEKVISQLAYGAVKISFGELRRLAAGVFINSGGEMDKKQVNLPLQEILLRLNPALLTRRTAKKVEVADDIVGPFGERGRGFTFTTQPLKGPSVPMPVPVQTSSSAEPPAALVPPMAVRQTSPPPMASPIPQRSATLAAPGGAGLATGRSPLPGLPLSPRSVTPALPGMMGGNGHAGNGNGNGHALPPTPGLRGGALDGNGHGAPVSFGRPAAPTAPAEPGATIVVALGDLSASWPQALQLEIVGSPLAHAKVALAASLILPGLKRGRIVVPWKQLRLLAQPGSAPSPNDHLELELPLNIIAPLFVAAQKSPLGPQSRASVSAEIPDLFFGFPQPAAVAPAPAAPAAPGTPPASATPLGPPLAQAREPKLQDTNYYALADKAGALAAAEAAARGGALQTDFLNRLTHPKEVVARATTLSGVAGAIVAMQDGLRVASQVPADLNSDTLAAFLPQIFERVNQCTRELRMGALNNINFTVGNVPWKIFRVNAVYFAAFGRAGEPLPSAQLAQLAAELDRKKTS